MCQTTSVLTSILSLKSASYILKSSSSFLSFSLIIFLIIFTYFASQHSQMRSLVKFYLMCSTRISKLQLRFKRTLLTLCLTWHVLIISICIKLNKLQNWLFQNLPHSDHAKCQHAMFKHKPKTKFGQKKRPVDCINLSIISQIVIEF